MVVFLVFLAFLCVVAAFSMKPSTKRLVKTRVIETAEDDADDQVQMALSHIADLNEESLPETWIRSKVANKKRALQTDEISSVTGQLGAVKELVLGYNDLKTVKQQAQNQKKQLELEAVEIDARIAKANWEIATIDRALLGTIPNDGPKLPGRDDSKQPDSGEASGGRAEEADKERSRFRVARPTPSDKVR